MSLIFAHMQRCPWNSARVVLGMSALVAAVAYMLHG
jgi:hypothetical protein